MDIGSRGNDPPRSTQKSFPRRCRGLKTMKIGQFLFVPKSSNKYSSAFFIGFWHVWVLKISVLISTFIWHKHQRSKKPKIRYICLCCKPSRKSQIFQFFLYQSGQSQISIGKYSSWKVHFYPRKYRNYQISVHPNPNL